VAEEEETARSPGTFASFEDHVAVKLWTQARVKVLEVVDFPDFIKPLKVVNLVKDNSDSCIDDHCLLLFRIQGLLSPHFDPVVLLEVFITRLVPVSVVFYLDLKKGQLDVIFINCPVHLVELLPDVLGVAQRDVAELSDALQNRVDQLHVERRRQEEKQGRHRLLTLLLAPCPAAERELTF